jgi:hypothetical protein
MAGYLDAYGVADARKERLIKRVVLISLAVAIVGVSAYFIFRNWRQEQVVKNFFDLLRDKEYQPAYALWGCTQDHPCKYYGPERFTADWGPSSPYANVSSIKIAHEDTCGSGVVFNIEQASTQSIGLYVDRDSNQISFAPAPRCPGRHLQLWEFLKSKFE